MKRESGRLEPKGSIKIRLRSKIMVGIVILLCLLMSATVLVVEHRMRESILDEFLKRGLSVARNLAAVNTNYITTYNYVNIEQSVEKIAEENSLAYAMVLLFDGEVAAYSGNGDIKQEVLRGDINKRALQTGEVLVQYGKFGSAEDEFCDIAVPILLKSEKWGTVRVGFSLKNMHAAILRTRTALYVLGLVALIAGCLISLILARRITSPIGVLVKSVEAMSNGEYEKEIRVSTSDEIGFLGNRFAAMQETLKDNIQLLTETNKELTQSNQRLQSLFQVSQAMNSLQNQEKLYDLILEAALTATGTREGSLTLLDQDQQPQIVATAGTPCPELYSFGVAGGNQFEGSPQKQCESLLTGLGIKPLLLQLEHFKKDIPFFTMRLDSDPTLELLSIPLQQAETLLGFINLTRKRKNGKVDPAEMQTLSILSRHASASLENKDLFVRLEDAYLSSIKSLAKTLEFKDEYTHGHAERVAEVCIQIGERMNTDRRSLKVLYNAALLHDIGKIGVMESILNKNTSLEASEWSNIKRHPAIGEEILKPIFSLREESRIVRHHHEREDGKGYPDGLYGNRLSLSEKIIIVADSFDSMRSKRAYRAPLDLASTKNELIKNKGSQFDPEVVDVFLEILEEGKTPLSTVQSHKIIPFQTTTHDGV
jgi:HD-GYP domain-containing protein (c-di-GMP phosphodiesterase class II)/HAMP domain-containing protein